MRYMLLVLVGFLFFGCATKHYGRQINLTSYEKDNFTCKELKLEVAKVEGFVNYVSTQSTTIDGKEVLAFLGDFGIGNMIEAQAAQESALIRINDLRRMQVRKECEVSTYFKNRYKENTDINQTIEG